MFLETGKSALSGYSDFKGKFRQKQKGKLKFAAKLYGSISRHLYIKPFKKNYKLWSWELGQG